jgi:hypothetical protein
MAVVEFLKSSQFDKAYYSINQIRYSKEIKALKVADSQKRMVNNLLTPHHSPTFKG